MVLWPAGELTFDLVDDDTDDPVVTVAVRTPDGTLRLMFEPRVLGREIVLGGLHTHGEGFGRNEAGWANLKILAQLAMERMDFDAIVVEGAVRTTGANPGSEPRPVRFTRRVRP